MEARRRSNKQHSSNEQPGSLAVTDKGPLASWALIRPSGDASFDFWCSVAVVMVVVCSVAEHIAPTAYGRFGSDAAKFSVDPRLGWWLMEIPCTVSFIYNFFIRGGTQANQLVPRLLAIIFCGHYLYRGWVFPALIRVHAGSSNFSLLPALGGWLVTILHGYLNARWYAEHGKHLNTKWLRSFRFWFGLALYYSGLVLIIWHDSILRELRSDPNGPRYRIPYGGLYQYATCPQYFVELLCWLGFAIMSWGPNGAFIFLVSCVNLIPRSVSTHQWYLNKFGEEYAVLDRKYLVPFVW